ncbi:MAG: molybdate ABC transporter substrate-binding protein, partial [Sphingomonadales bacterium]
MIARRGLLLGLGAVAVVGEAMAAPRAPLVLAAASLQESMNAAADAWAARGHVRPVCSFAASSALARQIAAGAAADLFISADEPWMDDVEKKGRIVPGTRSAFLGNRLVIVETKGLRGQYAFPAKPSLADLVAQGRIAIADPNSVPAGRYAKAAIEKTGTWATVEPRIVRGESVRAALAMVERGGAHHGIVYATDARASNKVLVIGVIPANAHPPIRYP